MEENINLEDLEKIGISTVQCQKCLKDIPKVEYNKYKGYCRECYIKKYKLDKDINEEDYSSDYTNSNECNISNTLDSRVRIIVRIVAIICFFIGLGFWLDKEFEVGIIIIIGAIVIDMIYSIFCEALDLLQEIAINTRK